MASAPAGRVRDPHVRIAFEKAIDRGAINQVVFNGLFVANNQTQVPKSTYWNPAHPLPARDLAGARALPKRGRTTTDPAQCVAVYRQVVGRYLTQMPQIYLYNYTWIWGSAAGSAASCRTRTG